MNRTVRIASSLVLLVLAVLSALAILDVIDIAMFRTSGMRVVSVIVIGAAVVVAIGELLRRK